MKKQTYKMKKQQTIIAAAFILASLNLSACTPPAMQNAAAEGLPPEEPTTFEEQIIGTWEMSTFHNGVDTSATRIEDATPITKELGTITFKDDGTFTVSGYTDDGDASVPFRSLFHTIEDYLEPETIHLVYTIESNSVLCLRYYGTTQVTNQFEVKDYALLLVKSDGDTLSFSYGSYPPYILTKI